MKDKKTGCSKWSTTYLQDKRLFPCLFCSVFQFVCVFCAMCPLKTAPMGQFRVPPKSRHVTHTDAALSRDHRGSHTYFVPDHRHGPILYVSQYTFPSYDKAPALFLVPVLYGVSDQHRVRLSHVLLSVRPSASGIGRALKKRTSQH